MKERDDDGDSHGKFALDQKRQPNRAPREG